MPLAVRFRTPAPLQSSSNPVLRPGEKDDWRRGFPPRLLAGAPTRSTARNPPPPEETPSKRPAKLSYSPLNAHQSLKHPPRGHRSRLRHQLPLPPSSSTLPPHPLHSPLHQTTTIPISSNPPPPPSRTVLTGGLALTVLRTISWWSECSVFPYSWVLRLGGVWWGRGWSCWERWEEKNDFERDSPKSTSDAWASSTSTRNSLAGMQVELAQLL